MQKQVGLSKLFFIYLLVLNCSAQKIKVVSFKTFGEKIYDYSNSIGKSINLPFDRNNIQIEFLCNDSKAQFECLLEKYDKNWVDYRSQNWVKYPNLDGGFYTFKVRQKGNSGNYAQINFEIEKVLWKRTWFIPMLFFYALVAFSILIYFILLYRFRQQTKLQRVRNDIASDLHDDVGATLSSISFFGEMMRSKVLKNAPPEEVLPLLEKLISTSKETIETMRGVVWTINPNNDTATDFFQKLNSFGKEMLAAKNIEFNFEAKGFENVKLPLDIQRNLFLFYKETINNIAKHSKATSVGVNIKSLSPFGEGLGRSDVSVRFDSTDNGIGFNPAELHEGHGLKSLRKRADELQGNLEIISAQGQGTKIILTFPLN